MLSYEHLGGLWYIADVTLPPLPFIMMAAMPSSLAHARYCLCRAVTWQAFIASQVLSR